MEAVNFTFPLRVECGFDRNLRTVTALAAEIDGRVEIEPHRREDDGADMTIYVEDAVSGEHRPLSPSREPDLHGRIKTWLLTDREMQARVDEAERKARHEEAVSTSMVMYAPEVA